MKDRILPRSMIIVPAATGPPQSSLLTSIIWALIIVIATWPAMVGLQARLRGRRGFAVAVMTIIFLLIIVVFLFAIFTIADNAENILDRIKYFQASGLPQPPEWIDSIPLIGPKIAERWHEYAALPPDELPARIAPYAQNIIAWFLNKAGGIGMMVVEFLLTVIISAIMYAGGEKASAGVLAFARRLAGLRGEEVTVLARICNAPVLNLYCARPLPEKHKDRLHDIERQYPQQRL